MLTTDSVCNLMGFDKSSHGVMNFDGDTAYTLTTTARDNAAKAGRPDERFVQIGRWLGECGADLKPGEMLVAGKKMSFIGKR